MRITKALFVLLAGYCGVFALIPMQMGVLQRHVKSLSEADSAKGKMGSANYTQYIDHKNPDLGTFKQLYFYDLTHWGGPGSPIVFNTPGEESSNRNYVWGVDTMPGAIAKEVNGGIITLEHRYYGSSSPYRHLTTKNLKYLTVEQAIADFVRFANHVHFPFDHNGSPSTATKVPWVFTGCSYPGALVGWTASTSPGTFWAYQASSAVVEAVGDFWTYFVPIEEGMPKVCLHDVQLAVKYIDEVLTHGSSEDKAKLKAKFKLEDLKHDTDFAEAILNCIYTGQFEPLGGALSFCNYVENVKHPRQYYKHYKGVGAEKAVDGWAKFWLEQLFPNLCFGVYKYESFRGKYNLKCLDTYDPKNPIYTDTNPNHLGPVRGYNWLACNQRVPFWSVAPPKDKPTIVSRLITTRYIKRQCGLYFPPGPEGQTFGSNGTNEVAKTNSYTRGWNFTNSTRLVWGNSEHDPYRSSTVSSSFRPGGPLKSTPERPVYVVKGGYHCGDYFLGDNNKKEFYAQVAHIKKWVAEFHSK